MKFKILVIFLLTLSSCRHNFSGKDLEDYTKICEPNGGIDHIRSHPAEWNATLVCKNNMSINASYMKKYK